MIRVFISELFLSFSYVKIGFEFVRKDKLKSWVCFLDKDNLLYYYY